MYLPRPNTMGGEIAPFLAAHPAGHLVTVGPDGTGPASRPASPGLVVVTAADAYISPSWYPSKAEHGRVVPTWNYSEVQRADREGAIDGLLREPGHAAHDVANAMRAALGD